MPCKAHWENKTEPSADVKSPERDTGMSAPALLPSGGSSRSLNMSSAQGSGSWAHPSSSLWQPRGYQPVSDACPASFLPSGH